MSPEEMEAAIRELRVIVFTLVDQTVGPEVAERFREDWFGNPDFAPET